MKRISIALGYEAGRRAKQKQVRKQDVIDTEFTKGFQLALDGQELSNSPDDLREAFLVFQKEITSRKKALAAQNDKIQKKFLLDNAKNQGVKKLKSGLQYLELTPRTEKTTTQTVLAHYRGTLLDETEFDASNGENPTELKLDELIPGFRQALQMMPVGTR